MVIHTYKIVRYRMQMNYPIRFTDGERVIAVVSLEPAEFPEPEGDMDVTFLVEVPEI